MLTAFLATLITVNIKLNTLTAEAEAYSVDLL